MPPPRASSVRTARFRSPLSGSLWAERLLAGAVMSGVVGRNLAGLTAGGMRPTDALPWHLWRPVSPCRRGWRSRWRFVVVGPCLVPVLKRYHQRSSIEAHILSDIS